LDQVPNNVASRISAGIDGKISETIKPGDPILKKISNVIVGDNTAAASAAVEAAKAFGFDTQLLTVSLQGEASDVGKSLAVQGNALFNASTSVTKPACLIAGGETNVTIKGTGLGGRNQELALGAAVSLSGQNQMILVSLATDGGDGPTDAAGAVVTNETYSNGLTLGLDPYDYLKSNDSYHYFSQLGDLIKTGPTLTNVNDLIFIFGF
jgi:hydroxypyruvate reductase